ncbi:MAG: transferase [Leptolyngbyaceae cyanobacterium RM2_2_4]|nr:transferase [Leptolyngbyaceae cyanobacterium SM1_4_3]NJN90055.1 transferase [Leptolyngbyaceae cyanobacterium SL_5_14]NJO51108.1 transferase [Leptolyngbyaceae cyanobacterium RM2_2_4]NJO67425.1 transferase [Leptolyngbyaceae cyanobacterium RM1_405_57]
MHLPPLRPISDVHFCVSGSVTIHPSAVVAPGVLLQADANSQIVIGAGVCIGAGTVLHVYQGSLEIEEGASLGASVLLFGSGRIGANACIGSRVTIFNSSIAPDQVVKSGSLVGDPSRSIAQTEPVKTEVAAPTEDSPSQAETAPTETSSPQAAETAPAQSSSALASAASVPIYGKAAVAQLIIALFPGRDSLNNLPPENQSSNNGKTPDR